MCKLSRELKYKVKCDEFTMVPRWLVCNYIIMNYSYTNRQVFKVNIWTNLGNPI